MNSQYGDDFVVSKASDLLKRSFAERDPLTPPIDLVSTFDYCGIIKYEYRLMVPEGVLHPLRGGFALYLQDNFRDQSSQTVRERFTVAHEVTYTFFFDTTHSPPRRRRGAPRGNNLERLCHLGAQELLLPRVLVERELRNRAGLSKLEDVEYLAERFQVSFEVVLRRLRRCVDLCTAELGIIYVAALDTGAPEVQAVFHDSSFRTIAAPPGIGEEFSSWIQCIEPRAAVERSGTWEATIGSCSIQVRKKQVGRRSSLIEIRRTQ